MSKEKICFVSCDVEGDRNNSGGFENVKNLDKILNIFEKLEIPATLFITGEALEKLPDLVFKWSRNYEIGCHNFLHQTLDKLDIEERRSQLEKFIALYGGLFKKRPFGFRAPRAVIDEAQFLLLEKYNFLYDSSVLSFYPPFKKYQGYKGRAPQFPYYPSQNNYLMPGNLKVLEIPMVPHLAGIPLSGTYLRYLGVNFFKFLFSLKEPRFVSVDCHSWDGSRFEGRRSKNSGPAFLEKLEKFLLFLKQKNYRFLNGEQIYYEFQKNLK